MLPPLPRCSGWVSSSLVSPSRVSLPRFHCRVGLHIDLFEACSAFTHVAACTLAQSPYIVTAIRGLQTFRHLHACPGCFRRERIAGWALHPLESAALSQLGRIEEAKVAARRGLELEPGFTVSGFVRAHTGRAEIWEPIGDALRRLNLPE